MRPGNTGRDVLPFGNSRPAGENKAFTQLGVTFPEIGKAIQKKGHDWPRGAMHLGSYRRVGAV
jgi:hypothetical protein